MTGKREEKKRILKDKILKASKEVFLKNGYEQATMEQIASRAEVGLGTAYNHFSSKDELFLLIMTEQIFTADNNSFVVSHCSDKDIVDLVFDYIYEFLAKIDIFSKRVWREVISAYISAMKSDNQLFERVIKVEYNFMDGIRQLLINLQEQKILESDFQVDEAVELIYGAVTFQLMWYLFSKDIELSQVTTKLKSQIKFILVQHS